MEITLTPNKLRLIFNTELPDDSLEVFCDAAAGIVTEKLENAGYPASRLEQIGFFLAAHLASTASPQAKSEKIGSEYSYTVQGETGMGLDATYYGQMVKLLDTSGAFANIGRKAAGIGVIR